MEEDIENNTKMEVWFYSFRQDSSQEGSNCSLIPRPLLRYRMHKLFMRMTYS
jgi:hypothetical protein